jgi:hypothetical protein
MKKRLLYAFAAGALIFAPATVMAQGAGSSGSGSTTANDSANDCTPQRIQSGSCEDPNKEFRMSPNDQQTFMTWVGRESHSDIAVPSGFDVRVGAVLPGTVTLYEIPSSAGVSSVTRYRYVRMGGRTILVNPTDRRIVSIIGG